MPSRLVSEWRTNHGTNDETIASIGGGGQGLTRKVQARDGSGLVAVLKTLKQARDPDRRGRMHREAEALRTLSHSGIPGLLDSNTAAFKDKTPLYMVIDFVDGPTLGKLVEQGLFSLEDAVGLTFASRRYRCLLPRTLVRPPRHQARQHHHARRLEE